MKFLNFLLIVFLCGQLNSVAYSNITPVPSVEEVLLIDATGSACSVSDVSLVGYPNSVDWPYLTVLAIPSLSKDPQMLPIDLLMVGVLAIIISEKFLQPHHVEWLYQNLLDSWEEYVNKPGTTDAFGFPEQIVHHITHAQQDYWVGNQIPASESIIEEVNNAIALISYIFTGDASRAQFIAEGGFLLNEPIDNKFVLNARSEASIKASDYYARISHLITDFCDNNICDANDIVNSEGDASSWFTSDRGRYLIKMLESAGRLTVGFASLGAVDPLDYGDQFMSVVTGHKGLKFAKFITKLQKKVGIEQALMRKKENKSSVKLADAPKAEKEFAVRFDNAFAPKVKASGSMFDDLLTPATWMQLDMEIAFAVALNSFTQILSLYLLNISPVKNPLMQDLKTLNYQMTFPLGTAAFAQKAQHLKALENMSLQVQSYHLPETMIGGNFDHHALVYIQENLNQHYRNMDLDGQLMTAGVKFMRALMAGALYWIGDYAVGRIGLNEAAPMVMLFKSLALIGIFAINFQTSAVALIDNCQQSDSVELEKIVQKRHEVAQQANSNLSDRAVAKIAEDYQLGGFDSLDAEAKIYLASIQAVHELAAVDSSFATVLLLESLWAQDQATVQFLKHMGLSDQKIDLLIESQLYPSKHQQAAEVLQSYLWKK